MNIKEAKQEIENTLRAYLAKDDLGNYLIPPKRQRPVLLMGPPGVGKTQIMEQIAEETGVGLLSYTMTHHTRQSAIGLPYIVHKEYGGEETPVTEYTMSEILASVYDLMAETGQKEGILFLDEINCVSETLTPVMLNFLQYKMFGNRKLPDGWLIVGAGNPPEYNRSAREFDVATMDRVKLIQVKEDFSVWKEYAYRNGLHGAVISYLDTRKENFFRIENTADGMRFVTARGWEDLSEMLQAYEKLGLPVSRQMIGEYIQLPQVARDFAGYLELYHKYLDTYHIDEILQGKWRRTTVRALQTAPFDEKLSVLGLLHTRLSEAARDTRHQEELADALHEDMLRFRDSLPGAAADPAKLMDRLGEEILKGLKADLAAKRLSREEQETRQKEYREISRYASVLRKELPAGESASDVREAEAAQSAASAQEQGAGASKDTVPASVDGNSSAAQDAGSLAEQAMDIVREQFGAAVDRRQELVDETGKQFDNVFAFLEEALGDSQEMVIFVTNITAGYDTSWYVQNFGCDAYYRHNRELLFDDVEQRIRREIQDADGPDPEGASE